MSPTVLPLATYVLRVDRNFCSQAIKIGNDCLACKQFPSLVDPGGSATEEADICNHRRSVHFCYPRAYVNQCDAGQFWVRRPCSRSSMGSVPQATELLHAKCGREARRSFSVTDFGRNRPRQRRKPAAPAIGKRCRSVPVHLLSDTSHAVTFPFSGCIVTTTWHLAPHKLLHIASSRSLL